MNVLFVMDTFKDRVSSDLVSWTKGKRPMSFMSGLKKARTWAWKKAMLQA